MPAGTPSGLPARDAGSFMARLLVDCPACGDAAVIDMLASADGSTDVMHGPRRLACTACPKRTEQPWQALSNPAMGLVPRLQVVTRHGVLVAYNEAHLDYLEAHIAGRLRREIPAEGGVRNRSVISRLPAWATSAKHRDEMLKAIARVRASRLPRPRA